MCIFALVSKRRHSPKAAQTPGAVSRALVSWRNPSRVVKTTSLGLPILSFQCAGVKHPLATLSNCSPRHLVSTLVCDAGPPLSQAAFARRAAGIPRVPPALALAVVRIAPLPCRELGWFLLTLPGFHASLTSQCQGCGEDWLVSMTLGAVPCSTTWSRHFKCYVNLSLSWQS